MALGDSPKINDFGNPPPPAKKEISFKTDLKEVFSFLKTLVVFLTIAFFLRATVVEAFKIPSGSMIPTLQIGDHILVNKFAYGLRIPLKAEMLYQYSEPKRGDVVVFTRQEDPSTMSQDELGINLIKRVIGLPGDTIEVKGTKLYINNVLYPEDYARWEKNGIFEGNFGPATVPAGHILLLGDNRDNSKDSRFWSNHFLDMKRIKGKAFIIYWSWDSLSRIGTLIK